MCAPVKVLLVLLLLLSLLLLLLLLLFYSIIIHTVIGCLAILSVAINRMIIIIMLSSPVTCSTCGGRYIDY